MVYYYCRETGLMSDAVLDVYHGACHVPKAFQCNHALHRRRNCRIQRNIARTICEPVPRKLQVENFNLIYYYRVDFPAESKHYSEKIRSGWLQPSVVTRLKKKGYIILIWRACSVRRITLHVLCHSWVCGGWRLMNDTMGEN